MDNYVASLAASSSAPSQAGPVQSRPAPVYPEPGQIRPDPGPIGKDVAAAQRGGMFFSANPTLSLTSYCPT